MISVKRVLGIGSAAAAGTVAGWDAGGTLGELVETFFNLLVSSDLPRPQIIPSLDVLPSQRLSPHNEISEQRAVGLWRLAARKTSITITPVASALLRTEPAEFYRQLALVDVEPVQHHGTMPGCRVEPLMRRCRRWPAAVSDGAPLRG